MKNFALEIYRKEGFKRTMYLVIWVALLVGNYDYRLANNRLRDLNLKEREEHVRRIQEKDVFIMKLLQSNKECDSVAISRYLTFYKLTRKNKKPYD